MARDGSMRRIVNSKDYKYHGRRHYAAELTRWNFYPGALFFNKSVHNVRPSLLHAKGALHQLSATFFAFVDCQSIG